MASIPSKQASDPMSRLLNWFSAWAADTLKRSLHGTALIHSAGLMIELAADVSLFANVSPRIPVPDSKSEAPLLVHTPFPGLPFLQWIYV